MPAAFQARIMAETARGIRRRLWGLAGMPQRYSGRTVRPLRLQFATLKPRSLRRSVGTRSPDHRQDARLCLATQGHRAGFQPAGQIGFQQGFPCAECAGICAAFCRKARFFLPRGLVFESLLRYFGHSPRRAVSFGLSPQMDWTLVFLVRLRCFLRSGGELTSALDKEREQIRRLNVAEIAFIVDLSRLPPHAIVAYAARCARRIQPLFARAAASGELAAAVERAIETAERIASGHALSVEDTGAAEAAEAAVAASAGHPAAHQAARAACYAARAACAADQAPYAAAAFGDDTARAARAAAMAAQGDPDAAADAAHYADYAGRTDYDRLVLLNRGGPPLGLPLHCTEDGPLGPLWPEGKPSWL